MKQNTNFRFWEPKGDEKLVYSYVEKCSYPWMFKINYYCIITPIGDVAWPKGRRSIKSRWPDSARRELQNKLNLIKIWSQEPNLALRAGKINYVTSWTGESHDVETGATVNE